MEGTEPLVCRETGIFFQNDPNYGIFVSNVVANSAAHQCGIILRGDFLTRVDNVEITSKTTLDQVNSTPLSSCNREGVQVIRCPKAAD